MSLLNRVKNKVFKSYTDVSVEYHAGGFFIRKRAAYLIFNATDTVVLYEREEGMHPDDNDYALLIERLLSDNKGHHVFSVSPVGSTMLNIADQNNTQSMILMPSVFIENMHQESLSEVLLDKRNGSVGLYIHVYTKKSTRR